MGSVRRASLWLIAGLLPLDLMVPLQITQAADLPSYMAPIAGTTTTTAGEVAKENLLALNSAMFDLYSNSNAIFQHNLLAKHPVILALFSGSGGRFMLYRPNQPPLDAPPQDSDRIPPMGQSFNQENIAGPSRHQSHG